MMSTMAVWKVAVPAVLLAAVAAGLTTWAYRPAGSGEALRYHGSIEYTITGADGRLKLHKTIPNTINADPNLETVMERLIKTGTVVASDAALFTRIVAFTATTSTDDPAGGFDLSSVTLSLEGDTGVTGAQNPAQGTYTNVGTALDGDGKITVTFTASADGTVVRQLALVKTAADDTASGGAVAIPDADVLAYKAVNITLDNGDTLQIEWTTNIS